MRGRRDGSCDDRRESGCVVDRPRIDDGVGDAAGEAFLAETADDVAEVIAAVLVDDVSCRLRHIRTHPHIDRASPVIGESTRCGIDLMR